MIYPVYGDGQSQWMKNITVQYTLDSCHVSILGPLISNKLISNLASTNLNKRASIYLIRTFNASMN